MLHVLDVLLLPATHGAQVKRAATVEARQGGQICTIQGILCTNTHKERGEGGGRERERERARARERERENAVLKVKNKLKSKTPSCKIFTVLKGVLYQHVAIAPSSVHIGLHWNKTRFPRQPVCLLD